MSPFLSNDVIKALHDKNPSLGPDAQVLITRAMSLGRLKPQDCHRFSVYTLKDAIVDGETAISDDGAQPQKQDIHAKLYMTRRYSDTDLYLGSLNASHNAISGNVEFMIRLRTKNRYLNLQKLTADLFGNQADGKDNPFAAACVEGAVADEDQERLHRLDQVVKEIAHTQPNACVMANTDRYDIMASFSITSYPYEVSISPLLSGSPEKLAEQVVFSGLSVTQLSEFYQVSVSDGGQTIRRILVIPTQGLPEDREKTVISNVIHDQSCFYRYIAFLLGDSVELGALELAEMTRTGSAGTSSNAPSMPALYEKMLKAAASSPEKLKEIDHLIRAVSDDGVIPEYFEQLYETFRKAVKLDG